MNDVPSGPWLRFASGTLVLAAWMLCAGPAAGQTLAFGGSQLERLPSVEPAAAAPVYWAPGPVQPAAPHPALPIGTWTQPGAVGPASLEEPIPADASPVAPTPYWSDERREDLGRVAPPAPEVFSPRSQRLWTLDFRCRSLASSQTSYEFGTPETPPAGWTPISRLEFPLDSVWGGLELGVHRPRWSLRAEWLAPMESDVHGDLADWDWLTPGAPFTDLGYAEQWWTDGQMLDVGLDVLLADEILGLPVQTRLVLGFRWQRFHVMCHDLRQVKWDNEWLNPPDFEPGNIIDFKQEYYLGYLGARWSAWLGRQGRVPIQVTLQADRGPTSGENIDHHLIREGDRYTIEETYGFSGHVGLGAEALLSERLSLGVELDYLGIRTTGTHRLLNRPLHEDYTWSHGVRVWSDQTWVTAYARLHF